LRDWKRDITKPLVTVDLGIVENRIYCNYLRQEYRAYYRIMQYNKVNKTEMPIATCDCRGMAEEWARTGQKCTTCFRLGPGHYCVWPNVDLAR
jgi:hypothetical protein